MDPACGSPDPGDDATDGARGCAAHRVAMVGFGSCMGDRERVEGEGGRGERERSAARGWPGGACCCSSE